MLHLRSVLALLALTLTSVVDPLDTLAQSKITIGYAAVSPRSTPLYIAQEQGPFAKYGLDPKIVLVPAAGQGSYLKILINDLQQPDAYVGRLIRTLSAPRNWAQTLRHSESRRHDLDQHGLGV